MHPPSERPLRVPFRSKKPVVARALPACSSTSGRRRPRSLVGPSRWLGFLALFGEDSVHRRYFPGTRSDFGPFRPGPGAVKPQNLAPNSTGEADVDDDPGLSQLSPPISTRYLSDDHAIIVLLRPDHIPSPLCRCLLRRRTTTLQPSTPASLCNWLDFFTRRTSDPFKPRHPVAGISPNKTWRQAGTVVLWSPGPGGVIRVSLLPALPARQGNENISTKQ